MRLIGKQKLEKLKRKKKRDQTLIQSIDEFVACIEINSWNNPVDLKATRPDADCVHSDGFYFFNIDPHRTMILIEFYDKEATVVWLGSHQEYEITFKNNKETIKKWLQKNSWI